MAPKMKILIIAPHPDDELLMCAGIIKRSLDWGCQVKVAVMTNGGGSSSTTEKGETRIQESLNGLYKLGLDYATDGKKNIFYFGYDSDGTLGCSNFFYNTYHACNGKKQYPANCSKVTYGNPKAIVHHSDGDIDINVEDYHYQIHGKHGAYCRDNFEGDLHHLFKDYNPDLIFTTLTSDTHAGHHYVCNFVKEIVKRLVKEKTENFNPEIVGYPIHVSGSCCDKGWPKRVDEIVPFQYYWTSLFSIRYPWKRVVSIQVPKSMRGMKKEESLKYLAIDQHKIPLKNSSEYLRSFVKEDEIFWVIRKMK